VAHPSRQVTQASCIVSKVLIETERLILRRFMPSDYEALNDLLGDAGVMESSVDGPLNRDQVRTWLKEQIDEYTKEQGNEVLAVVNKSTAELIGYCGLFQFPNIDGICETEVGYRFMRKSWGNGYATEAAAAIRDYAFSLLNLARLIALIEPTNKRSIRVAKKIGMKYEKDVMLEEYDYPDHLYSMCNTNENA
jgi:ribosomal-protein-alanine N-acetyltransferase